MKLKILLIAACTVLAGVCLTACTANTDSDKIELLEAANARLESTVAQKRELSRTNVYDAKVIPSFEELSFDIDGYVYGIFVSPGEEVEEGEVLATLVSKDYSEMKSLREEIKNLSKNEQESFKMRDAEIELMKTAGQDAAEKELILKHDKERSALELELKKERLQALEDKDIGFRYIFAPCDCIAIAASDARNGTFVKAGTSIVALETDSEPILTCEYMNEKNYKKLHDCYAIIDGERYELEYIPYTKSELKSLSASSNIVISSKFRILGDKQFSAGQSAAVITVSDYKEDVLSIPSNAVYSDSTGKFVYVVENDLRTKRSITTGISDGTYTEVLEGLEEGALVYVKN